jgi:hypothetical protein
MDHRHFFYRYRAMNCNEGDMPDGFIGFVDSYYCDAAGI